ncbi:RICIN domain-containing protein [Dactylosporangium salmoneum]
MRNPQSGRCLDDPSGVTTNGTRIQIWDCNGANAQVWRWNV